MGFFSWGKKQPERACLANGLRINMAMVESAVVTRDGATTRYEPSDLTEEQLRGLVQESLDATVQRLELNFLRPGETIFIKRLNKHMQQQVRTTLVVHHVDGQLVCLYFDGAALVCHRLICNFHIYRNVDSSQIAEFPVGQAMIPEYLIHNDPVPVAQALSDLLREVETANERLSDSQLWSSDLSHFGGEQKYDKMRRELGLIEL